MRLGLRLKSGLALGLSAASVLGLAALIGSRVIAGVQNNLGHAFARNATQFNKQRLLTPVARELALSQRFAESGALHRFLQNPDAPGARAGFYEEADGFKKSFADHSYFMADIRRGIYFFNDPGTPRGQHPFKVLNTKNKDDAWFFDSVRNTQTYNLNVDINFKLKQKARVFINVMHRENGRKSAIAGTGLDLSRFIHLFLEGRERGVTPMILGPGGAIQVHPDAGLIALNSGSGGKASSTIFNLIPPDEKATLQQALEGASADPNSVRFANVTLGGKPQLLAISFLPDLKWHVVTAVDLNAAQLVDPRTLALPLALGIGALLLLLALVSFAVNRVVLVPLLRLTHSVRAVESGRYDIELPPAKEDEVGDLSRAFGAMTAQIRSHTDELEARVALRTKELSGANEKLAGANKQINDSIEYARLIQSAILPGATLRHTLGEGAAVLWLPRDVVGGDFPLFRVRPHGCLLGVVDCAGHGVPGALMTMMAHGAFNHAMDSVEEADPAAILQRADAALRVMLPGSDKDVATMMDAALVALDFRSGQVTFSGAKMNLFWSDGERVESWKGARHAVGGKKVPAFHNETLARDCGTFTLSSDGFFDQNGGERGYSFGSERFAALLQSVAQSLPSLQIAEFERALSEFRGTNAQRDDITVMCFQPALFPASVGIRATPVERRTAVLTSA